MRSFQIGETSKMGNSLPEIIERLAATVISPENSSSNKLKTLTQNSNCYIKVLIIDISWPTLSALYYSNVDSFLQIDILGIIEVGGCQISG